MTNDEIKKKLEMVKDILDDLGYVTAPGTNANQADHKRITTAYFSTARALWHFGQPLEERDRDL